MLERTVYPMFDEHGDKSSITLDKTVADVLQARLPDVHAWVQDAYNRVVAKYPDIGRVKKGDLVRVLAQKEAEKYPEYAKIIDDLIGAYL